MVVELPDTNVKLFADVPVEDALNISAWFNVEDDKDDEYPILAAPSCTDKLPIVAPMSDPDA